VLVREKQEEHQKKQLPVYYVSKTLDGAKKFYTEMEKVAYAVVMASRKLEHYF
jgi:predicted amino acid racemase